MQWPVAQDQFKVVDYTDSHKDFQFIVKPESQVPMSKVPKSRPKGLGLTLKSHVTCDVGHSEQ